MELDTGIESKLEERQVKISLPSEVWEILDGTNKIALAAGSSGFEAWIETMIIQSVQRCLEVAIDLATMTTNHSGNA